MTHLSTAGTVHLGTSEECGQHGCGPRDGGTPFYVPTEEEMAAIQALDTALVRINAADGYLASFTHNTVSRALRDVLLRMFGETGGDAVDQFRLDNHGEPNSIQLALTYVRDNSCTIHGYTRYGCPCGSEEN